MTSYTTNDDGYISGLIEWYVLDYKGQFKNDGECLYINFCWIHPKERRTKILKELIRWIDNNELSKTCKWVYWNRFKYNRVSKLYSRERLAKIGEKE